MQWVIVQGVFAWGAIVLGKFIFQVVSPSDTFTTFNMIMNCSHPRSSAVFFMLLLY